MDVLNRKPIFVLILTALTFVLLIPIYIASSAFATSHSKEDFINNIIFSDAYTLDLNEIEKDWLNNKTVIRLGIDRAFPPFGSITDEGKYVGFTADVMRIVKHRLKLDFEILKDTPWSKTIEMAQAGELDMISAAVNTRKRQKFLSFTNSYITNPNIIINNGEMNGFVGSLKRLEGKTVAIEKGSFSANVLSRDYPLIKLDQVVNTSKALELVSKGEADAYVGNGVTATYAIRELGFDNLSYSGGTEYSSGHSVGVIRSKPILASIMQKTMNSIHKNDLDVLSSYWFRSTSEAFITKQQAWLYGLSLGGLFLFLGGWIYGLKRTKDKLKLRQNIILEQSEVDYLTGLSNRRKFYQELNIRLNKPEKEQKPFVLLFIDLDYFKQINDALGHAVGDLLLVEIAKGLSSCVGEKTLVSRIGGDEFVIIIDKTQDTVETNKLSEAILRKFRQGFEVSGNRINITSSIGITSYPDDSKDLEQLTINADQAMYASKSKGRDCYSYFDLQMKEEAQYKINLISDLKNAIIEDQFSILYQPIADIKTNTINKVEALIRWQHPERGLISPAEFIPMAEEAGLIKQISSWAFKKSVDDAVEFKEKLGDNFQVSINISPIQFSNGNIDISFWNKYINERGLTGKNFIIEITEGVLMEASDNILKTIDDMRAMGIEVAIDDFGTGYSSFAYLKKFNIDYIKIDCSFINNLTKGSDDEVLVKAIIVMAHQLRIKVVAEGVETKEQRDILIENGCLFGQGFLYSKPINNQSLTELLSPQKSKAAFSAS